MNGPRAGSRSRHVTLAALLAAAVGVSAPVCGRPAERESATDGNAAATASRQDANQAGLPFGITPGQLPQTVITLEISSTKINSGFDEITVRGDGAVTLRAASAANVAPRQLGGRVDPVVVARLLQLLRAEGVENWDAQYPPEATEYVTKALTIAVGTATRKEVVVSRPEFAEFARVVGAIRLVAALARPEALGGFFQRI